MRNKLGGHLEFTKDLQLYGVISQLIEAEISAGSLQISILTNEDSDELTDLDKDNVKYAKRLAETHEKNLNDLIVMTSSTGNLADIDEEAGTFYSTISEMVDEVMMVDKIGLKYYQINPGKVEITHSEFLDKEVINLFDEDHVEKDLTVEDLIPDAIEQLSVGINEVHDQTEEVDIVLLLDMNVNSITGNNVCHTFEQLAEVIEKVEDKTRIGVSLDTAKLYAAGYDIVEDFDGVIEKFNSIVGLKYLKVLHICDSKSELGSQLKKRADIGEGLIGKEVLEDIVRDERFTNIPKTLTTPKGRKHFSK